MNDPATVHVHHCCKKWCTYGDNDCPVVLGTHAGMYQCEDCDCLDFNPGAGTMADEWWNSLSPAARATVYLHMTG